MKELIKKMYEVADLINLDLCICLDEEKSEGRKAVFRIFLTSDYYKDDDYQRDAFASMYVVKEPFTSKKEFIPVMRVTTCKDIKELMDGEMKLIPSRRSEEIIKEKGMKCSLRERMRICNRAELCDYTAEEIQNMAFETVIKEILVQITFMVKGVAFKSFYKMDINKVELEDKMGNIILPTHELVECCETGVNKSII